MRRLTSSSLCNCVCLPNRNSICSQCPSGVGTRTGAVHGTYIVYVRQLRGGLGLAQWIAIGAGSYQWLVQFARDQSGRRRPQTPHGLRVLRDGVLGGWIAAEIVVARLHGVVGGLRIVVVELRIGWRRVRVRGARRPRGV